MESASDFTLSILIYLTSALNTILNFAYSTDCFRIPYRLSDSSAFTFQESATPIKYPEFTTAYPAFRVPN